MDLVYVPVIQLIHRHSELARVNVGQTQRFGISITTAARLSEPSQHTVYKQLISGPNGRQVHRFESTSQIDKVPVGLNFKFFNIKQ